MRDSYIAPEHVADKLRGLWQAVVSSNWSMAIVQLPADEHFVCYLSRSLTTYESGQAGFVVHAFDTNAPTQVIAAECILVFDDLGLANIIGDYDWVEWVNHIEPLSFVPVQLTETTARDVQAKYLDGVAQITTQIKAKKLRKGVLSRTRTFDTKGGLDVIALFFALKEQYPHAHNYCCHTSQWGTWFGASPETFWRQDNALLHLQALAATRRLENHPDGIVEWEMKELEEHDIVVLYLIQTLKMWGIPEYEQSGPDTVQAGHLLHLRSDFVVPFTTLKLSQINELWADLHPTPAVGGMPSSNALTLIQQLEPHNRQLYTGFMGPVEPDRQALFVNLRCGQITENGLILYAGAGLTSASLPETEWLETEAKSNVLLSVIQAVNGAA